MAKKHYPVQRKIRLGESNPTSNNATMIVRTDLALSQVNHRLYRQSRVYKCNVTMDGTGVAPGTFVDVYALSDTWMNQKAYQLAKRMYDENSAEEKEQLGKHSSRWLDFRVDHGFSSAAVIGPVVEADTATTDLIGEGEYTFSEVANTLGTTNTFRWVGSGANTFNIITEYDNTANTDQTPSSPVGANVAYDGLTDELDDNQMDHLSTGGDNPPYTRDSLETSCWTRVARLFFDASGATKLTTGFFHAPCGLIWIEGGGGGTSTTLENKLTVEVQGGDYKGVAAPNYLG